MADAKAEVKPKKLQKGTPEGDKLIRVRCMRRLTYGPSPKLERVYEVGEELTIPMWRFTDWHNPEVITTPKGEQMTFRGSFERADLPKPIDPNVPQHSEDMQEVLKQNEELRRRLAAYDNHETFKAMPDEVQVIPDSPESFDSKKRGKKAQEI